MIKRTLQVMFAALLLSYCGNSAPNMPQAEAQSGWQLVWSDEFETAGLPNASKWNYDVGGQGWGNQELQYYTARRAENARVENGMLVIEARRESMNGNEYTSARMVTKGKGDWTYGRMEIRANLPAGRGTWPAIWMLPSQGTYGNGGWPDNGEIDIMEHVGYDPGWIHGSVHTKKYYWLINTQKTAKLRVADAQSAFHVYAVEWSPEQIEVSVDSVAFFKFKNEGTGWEVWPFDKNFHLVLNLAVGGAWGGLQGVDNSIFPQRMEIDYVRVYQRKP